MLLTGNNSFAKQNKSQLKLLSCLAIFRYIILKLLVYLFPQIVPSGACRHTLKATSVTAYLGNGCAIKNVQLIAARTTKLHDRTSDEITLDEVERIAI